MTLFRPCIDLHDGKVKQIVGGTLDDSGASTNFVSEKHAASYADLYRSHGFTGGHVISLGPGNEQEALSALAAYPSGLQYGGGVNEDNAVHYLDAGASHVILTSWLFDGDRLNMDKLRHLAKRIGKDKLVLDLSCRKREDQWFITTNRWQTVTNTAISVETLGTLAGFCDEFLVHAADVEGLQQGIDEALVAFLGKHSPIPATYAGGARDIQDLEKVDRLSMGRVDLTIGSALDIFGGEGITLSACKAFNAAQKP